MVDNGHGSSMDNRLTNHRSDNECMVDHGHGNNNDAWMTMVIEVAWMHG